MDRSGRKATIVPGFALMSIGLLAMVIVPGLKLPFANFAGALVCVHLAISITSGSMQTLGIDSAPPEWRGRFLGFLRLGSEFGQFLSPIGFALFATSLGYPAAFGFLMVTGEILQAERKGPDRGLTKHLSPMPRCVVRMRGVHHLINRCAMTYPASLLRGRAGHCRPLLNAVTSYKNSTFSTAENELFVPTPTTQNGRVNETTVETAVASAPVSAR